MTKIKPYIEIDRENHIISIEFSNNKQLAQEIFDFLSNNKNFIDLLSDNNPGIMKLVNWFIPADLNEEEGSSGWSIDIHSYMNDFGLFVQEVFMIVQKSRIHFDIYTEDEAKKMVGTYLEKKSKHNLSNVGENKDE